MPENAAHDPQRTLELPVEPNASSTLDVTGASHSAPDTLPLASAPTGDLPSIPAYAITGEIARGGMGRVLAGRELALDREVAIKVLLPGANAERFITESKITAKLPHPNIPPVHALGTLADGSPFLAMKLIRGRTLAAELGDRLEVSADLPRFVQVFEQIAQAVGFAHSRGIIHRDLKPLNVMVGEFGEVQVMDWGLAKDLASPGRESGESSIGEDTPHTLAGAIFGTAAYMPPEQARGEPVDARADVFALGATLMEILTGERPWGSGPSAVVIERASRALLESCHETMAQCPADPELVSVARKCLSADATDRYPGGRTVADAVAAYRTGVEQRLKQAETQRAEAVVREAEQRKRRKVQVAFGLAVVAMVAAGVAFTWWQQEQSSRRERDESLLMQEREFKENQARQGVATNLALATNLRRRYQYTEAEAALAQAAELAKGAEELAPAVELAKVDLAFVVRLDDIRYRKWLWLMGREDSPGTFNTAIAAPDYHRAFSAQDLDLKTLVPAAAAARIAASGVKAEVVAALDDWALYEPDPGLRNRLLDVARRADPGRWTDRLRDPAVRENRGAIATLAADADVSRLPPAVIQVVAVLMTRHGLDPRPTLTAARTANPTEFELAFYLGQCQHGGPAIGPYEAAGAMRPDNRTVGNNLGTELYAQNQLAEAEAVLLRTVAFAPTDAVVQYNLANVFLDMQKLPAAIAGFRRSIDLDPKLALAHLNLGISLKRQNDIVGAIASYRQAIAHDPNFAAAYANLGGALRESKDEDGAFAALSKAIELDPKLSKVQNALGNVLRERKEYDRAVAAYRKAIEADPAYAMAHYNLGNVLRDLKQTDGGIAAYRRAIELDPKYQFAHHNLGNALRDKGDVYGAIAAYTRALELDPTDMSAHQNLGLIALDRNDLKQALEAFRTAIQLKPTSATAHNNLGKALFTQQDVLAATAAFRTAIDLDPRYALAHANLAIALRVQKKYPEAIAAAHEAIKLNPKIASAHNTLGVALRATGNAESAQAAFAEAARLDPKLYGKAATRELAPPPRPAK